MPDLSLSQLADFAKMGENSANSFAAPFLNGQKMISGYYQNQMAPQNLQAQLSLLQNQSALAGAQSNLANASAGYRNTENDLLKKQTPFKVNQSQADIFSDPLMRQAYQAYMANNGNMFADNNARHQSSYANPGFPTPQNGMTGPTKGMPPPSPNVAQGMPSAPQPNDSNNFSGNLQSAPNGIISSLNKYVAPVMNWNQDQTAQGAAKVTSSNQDVSNWNDKLQEAAHIASAAGDRKKNIIKFSEHYDKSPYVGPVAGTTKTTGLGVPFGSNSDEQLADQAGAALQADTSFAQQEHGGGVATNYKLELAKKISKLDRTLDKNAKKVAVDALNATTDRDLSDRQAFYLAARHNPKKLTAQEADNLWNYFDQQRPLYDSKNERANLNFSGYENYSPYLSDKAIDDMRQGKPVLYVPKFKDELQKENWYSQLPASFQNELQRRVKVRKGNG